MLFRTLHLYSIHKSSPTIHLFPNLPFSVLNEVFMLGPQLQRPVQPQGQLQARALELELELELERPRARACKCRMKHMGCTRLVVEVGVGSWCMFRKCRSLRFHQRKFSDWIREELLTRIRAVVGASG
jgi:hypothetical protein